METRNQKSRSQIATERFFNNQKARELWESTMNTDIAKAKEIQFFVLDLYFDDPSLDDDEVVRIVEDKFN